MTVRFIKYDLILKTWKIVASKKITNNVLKLSDYSADIRYNKEWKI